MGTEVCVSTHKPFKVSNVCVPVSVCVCGVCVGVGVKDNDPVCCFSSSQIRLPLKLKKTSAVLTLNCVRIHSLFSSS